MADQDTPPPTITAMKIPIIKKGEYDIWSMRMRQYIYAKSLWAAIKSRFGGNEESKKMQKNVLKHQFENLTTALNESLDKAYDRFQKLISQLEVHGALNLAFLSAKNTNSTNEANSVNGNSGVSTTRGASSSNQVSSTSCYVEVAMLTIRVKKFIQKTGINLDFKEKQLVSFDKSKVECYNCHRKGHFARECKSRRNQGRRSYVDNGRSNAPTNESSSQVLVAQDGLGGYDSSNDFEIEPVNYALMAISSSSSSSSSDNEVQNCSKQCIESFKTLQKNLDSKKEKHNKARLEIQGYELALESLESRILGYEKNELAWGYGTQLDEMSNKSETDSEISMSVFEVRSSDEEKIPANDRFSKADGYHDVPPLITRNFLTPRAGISFIGIGFKKVKACFVCKSTKHLIKDCDFYDKKCPEPKLKNVVNAGQRVVKPVWDNVKRVNHQIFLNKLKYPQAKRTFVPSGVVTKTGLVNPVRQNEKRAVHTVSTARPISTTKPVSTARPIRPLGNPKTLLQDHAVVDSSCSSHMTGNKAYLLDYEDYNRGFVAFGSDSKGGKITGKGRIRTANLDFDDVYFVDELKFNLFFVSQICDKKNSVLFTDTECLILSPSFKLLDESQVFLRAPRLNDVYSLDLKNIVLFVGLENQLDHKVKIIRSDHGTEFKNHAMNEFCAKKGIKKEFSVARTPQQNGVTERKNRTLIEAARTMLADSLLPISF
ncbi:ribonuclease H-like domain-containing protein [Tanacetum coccineum]